jgi:hypothetical protein
LIDDGIDDCEVMLRKTRRDFVDVAGEFKADRKDLVVFFVCQHCEIWLIVRCRTRDQHGDIGAEFRFGGRKPAIGTVVERTVSETAHIGDHRQPDATPFRYGLRVTARRNGDAR